MSKKSFDFLYWKGKAIYAILHHPPIGRKIIKKDRAKMERDLALVEKAIIKIAKKDLKKHPEKYAC